LNIAFPLQLAATRFRRFSLAVDVLFVQVSHHVLSMRPASGIITIFLLIGLTVQINYVATYCILFALNRKAIAEKLCEKKTRHCCGKCYLNKKIAAAEEQTPSHTRNQPASSQPQPKSPDPLEAIQPCRMNHGLLDSISLQIFDEYCRIPTDGFPCPVYQPPELIPYIGA
jgi:hypothetical protein